MSTVLNVTCQKRCACEYKCCKYYYTYKKCSLYSSVCQYQVETCVALANTLPLALVKRRPVAPVSDSSILSFCVFFSALLALIYQRYAQLRS